jgi:membrane associated rhomboid family serine protease
MKNRKFFNANATFLLLAINVVCFVLFSILIYFNNNFLDYIALKPSNIVGKFYLWTFLTSMFMHGGFFHLFANMISLMFSAGLVEKILGKRRFISFYLISGLFAGIFFVLASLIFQSDFSTYAVGASGALFGLIGLLMILTPNLPVYIMFIPIPVKMKFAAPFMLAALWLISLLGNVPIGNTAHLGGLLAGIAYGFYLKNKYKKKTKYLSKYFS